MPLMRSSPYVGGGQGAEEQTPVLGLGPPQAVEQSRRQRAPAVPKGGAWHSASVSQARVQEMARVQNELPARSR
jgi:hypothetical protein